MTNPADTNMPPTKPIHQRTKLVIGALLLLAMLLYFGTIVRARSNAGATPAEDSAGSLAFVKQRAMEQFCTGVVETPKATWLAGYASGDVASSFTTDPSKPVVLIDALLGEGANQDADSGFSMLTGLRREEGTTFISRRNAEGHFELKAVVGERACLLAHPSGSPVFLLTGLKRPPADNPDNPNEPTTDQLAVFRSDDQGETWHWLREGLFPQAEHVAWSLRPGFFGKSDMWVFGDAADTNMGLDEAPTPGAIYHSRDLGRTVETIAAPAEMRLPLTGFAPHLPQGTEIAESLGDELKRYVFQVSADRAFAWTSQRVMYAHPEASLTSGLVCTIAMTELSQRDGRWLAGEVKREFGACLRRVQQRPDGGLVGVLAHPDQERDEIAEFDVAEQSWKPVGALPNPFWPLPGSSRVDSILVGQHAIVVSVMASHTVPTWLTPFRDEPAEIDANAAFYSLDGGRSWTRIGLPGYLGVMGLDPNSDRVYGAHGNWYDDPDLTVRVFSLKQ